MSYLFKAVHKIDYDAESVVEVGIQKNFDSFLRELLKNIDKNIVTKAYKPSSQSTQVVSNVRDIINLFEFDDIAIDEKVIKAKEYAEDIAKRLLDKEIKKQEQISHMGHNVKKGSLIQAVIKNVDAYTYLLAKVEHSSFIDDLDFSVKSGFAIEEKKIWKTCVLNCEIDTENEYVSVTEASIYINNTSKYWADDFLELKEMSTDAENTKKAFKWIEATLIKDVKKNHPADYMLIRNMLVGCMKHEQQLNYDEMISNIIDGYDFETLSEKETIALKNKLIRLPEIKKFDRLFTVVPKEIKAKIKQLYKVNEGIEIKVDDFVEDLKNTITAGEDVETGERYIKIKTNNEEVYNQFR